MHNMLERDPLLGSKEKFVLYKRRWFMLLVVVLFNISNAMIWITFAPVANYSASYFNVSESTVNWFSLVFFVAFVPCCGVAWWTIEDRGFRFSVIAGTLINAAGGIIRVVGVYVCGKPSNKFIVVLVGQILSACTQPLVLSMPTKLAALWFGDHERTIANTVASIANPVGVLLSNGIAAGLVKKTEDLEIMLIVNALPGVVAFLLAIFGFTSSEPPTKPSASALTKPVSFFRGVKKVACNKQFILLALAAGGGIGSFSAITSLIQQIICVTGYNNTIAGVSGAMVIVGGLIGSAILGLYVDRSRKYIEVAKIMALLMGLSGAAIIIASSQRAHPVLLVVSFTLFGMCGLGVLPVFLELGVECTYPVDEATSSGIQWMVGQVFGAVMMVGSLAAAPYLTTEEIKHSTCEIRKHSKAHPVNLMIPMIVMLSVSLIFALLFVMFFHTKYKRLLDEANVGSRISPSPCSEIIE